MKIITADEAGALIPDEATIFLGGLAVTGLAEEVLHGLERTFLQTGHPRQLSSRSMVDSTAKADWVTPKPRNAPAGVLLVYMA